MVFLVDVNIDRVRERGEFILIWDVDNGMFFDINGLFDCSKYWKRERERFKFCICIYYIRNISWNWYERFW